MTKTDKSKKKKTISELGATGYQSLRKVASELGITVPTLRKLFPDIREHWGPGAFWTTPGGHIRLHRDVVTWIIARGTDKAPRHKKAHELLSDLR